MPGPSSKVGGGYLSLRPFSQALTGTLDKARDQRIQDTELQQKAEFHELRQIQGYTDFYDDLGTPAATAAPVKGQPIPEVNFNIPQDPEALLKKQYIAGETNALIDGNIDGKLVHDNSDTKGFSMTELANNFAFDAKASINNVVSDKNLSPREKALAISQAKQSVQQFGQARNTLMQGAQKYLSELSEGKVSKFTDSKTADFWNTIASGKARWSVQDGYIVGETLSGDPIRQPLNDLSQLPKWTSTSLNLDGEVDDLVTKLSKETREIPDPNRPGVTITTKGFTDDKRVVARNYFDTLLPDKKSIGEAAVDYLGMDPFSVKENLRNTPKKTREAILDQLAKRVGGLVGPPIAASSKTDQAATAARAREDQYFERTRFNERHLDSDGSSKPTSSELASDIASNLENAAYWGSKKIDGKQVANSGVKDGILTLKLITGSSKGKPVTVDVKYNLKTSDGVEKLARETGADSEVIRELKSIIGYDESEKLPTNILRGGGTTQAPVPAQSDAAKRAAELIAKHRG